MSCLLQTRCELWGRGIDRTGEIRDTGDQQCQHRLRLKVKNRKVKPSGKRHLTPPTVHRDVCCVVKEARVFVLPLKPCRCAAWERDGEIVFQNRIENCGTRPMRAVSICPTPTHAHVWSQTRGMARKVPTIK